MAESSPVKSDYHRKRLCEGPGCDASPTRTLLNLNLKCSSPSMASSQPQLLAATVVAWPMMLLILATSSGLPVNIASCRSACLPPIHSCNSSSQLKTKSSRLQMHLETCPSANAGLTPSNCSCNSLATAGVLILRRLEETAAFVSPAASPHRECSHSLCASHPTLLHLPLLRTLQSNSQTLDFRTIHTVENRQCCFELCHLSCAAVIHTVDLRMGVFLTSSRLGSVGENAAGSSPSRKNTPERQM